MSRSQRLRLLISAAAVIVGLVIALAPAKAKSSGPKGEVFLETQDSVGQGAFSPSAAAPTPAAAANLPPAPVPATSGGGIAKVPGTAPGLYGGVQDEASCKTDQLVAYFAANPDKAQAFATALGISASDLGSYLGGLVSVVLRADTRVTEFGFRDGRAVPRQSVLQSGTAVLIDKSGVPRVRCGAGNPLAEPRAVASTTPRYSGSQWPGFRPGGVVVVAPTPPATTIIIVDLRTGVIIVRTGPGSTDLVIVSLPKIVRQGQRVTVTGRDWPPGTLVTITFDAPAVTLGTATAGGDGGFATTVVVPLDAALGLRTINITGAGLQSQMQVYVLPRPGVR